MNKKETFSKYKGSLKSLAFDPSNSLGRRYYDDPDSMYGILDPFFLDREKIRLSKSYRKMADKTQVFPPGTHSSIRNRLIHTNDVINLTSVYASILGLNVNLAEAIAYGHDIGHTAHGHLGEESIRDLSGNNFSHNVMSVVVAQKIERKGKGLNLTYETLEGILRHSRGVGELKINSDVTEEATLVMYADKIAYTFSDLNDALKTGFIKQEPPLAEYFGKDQRERIADVSYNLIMESSEEGKVSFSKSQCSKTFSELKSWMYENVYYAFNKTGKKDEIFDQLKLIRNFIQEKFNGKVDPYLIIAYMTDNEANSLFRDIKNNNIKELNYGFTEVINNFFGKEINIFDADLSKANFSKEYL